VTLALSQFDDQAQGIEVIFFALGCLVLLSQVFVFMVPDKAKAPKLIEAVEVAAVG
jgi:hypothetical protein